MNVQIKKTDLYFLLVCFALAILAEQSFFHGGIGVSYLVFITGFYTVFFIRFRNIRFSHRRIGLLLMVSIWILAASYLLYDNTLFNLLNILVIPAMVLVHIVLVTAPKEMEWHTPQFVHVIKSKIGHGIKYNFKFMSVAFNYIFKNMDEKTASTIKRVLLGLLFSLPILLVVTSLLMSADAVFEELVGRIPNFIVQLDFQEQLFRGLVILFFLFVFFGLFQRLTSKSDSIKSTRREEKSNKISFDSVIVVTILLLLNSVYLLFTIIQFTYFFGNSLQAGLTYAEYARKGFFELIVVTLVNWTVLFSSLVMVKEKGAKVDRLLKVMYSLLIGFSAVLLASAYQRLSLYESAYGFTMDRVLAHAFMVFLFIIFAYTFIRVWMEKLSLVHFYLIASLLFYSALNIMPLEKIIVDNNLERYHQTGKLDINYLNRFSDTGVEALIHLYQDEPDFPELKKMLQERQQMIRKRDNNWQAYNFTKQRVKEKLVELDFE